MYGMESDLFVPGTGLYREVETVGRGEEMSTLNYLCRNDVSDEDCYKCMKYGILIGCPSHCEYFDDVRSRMTPEQLEERERIMKIIGANDPFPVQKMTPPT